MNRMMGELGRSIQGSMQCACNLQSGATTNCAQIPNIESCETNPNLPNCGVYAAVDLCNPTSPGYNQQQCNCAQNPQGCTVISGTPPPSMFGGNLNNGLAPSGFAGNLGGGSGGLGVGGFGGQKLGFWCELGCTGISALCIAASLGNPLAVMACIAGELKCLSSC